MSSSWEQGSVHRVVVVRGGVSSSPGDEQEKPNGKDSTVHLML